MGGRPTDLLGWAKEMDRVADMCRDEGLPRRIEEGNRDLAKLLRQAAAENAALREQVAVLERVKDEAALFLDGGGECSCGCWSAWSGVKSCNLIAALAAAKPKEADDRTRPVK